MYKIYKNEELVFNTNCLPLARRVYQEQFELYGNAVEAEEIVKNFRGVIV